MSRYISKLPPEVSEYCDGNCGKYKPILCKDGLVRCLNCHRITQEHQSNCTCNSRTVDEKGNVVHFEECDKEKDKLDELIEFIEDELDKSDAGNITFKKLVYVKILNKAKEIKENNGK